jgi:hypothetical protein
MSPKFGYSFFTCERAPAIATLLWSAFAVSNNCLKVLEVKFCRNLMERLHVHGSLCIDSWNFFYEVCHLKCRLKSSSELRWS